MNAIAFCLDLILASLLLAALVVGLRLDRKLKALKDSQTGFVNAVADLDGSIVKAQDSLATLRAAAAQAETTIADRLQDARGATARLDQQTKSAGAAAEKLERLLERYPSSAAPRPTAPPRETSDPGALSMRDRIAAGLPSHGAIAPEALSRTAARPESNPAPRFRPDERNPAPRRASGDDDLFELIEPALRAARSGRR